MMMENLRIKSALCSSFCEMVDDKWILDIELYGEEFWADLI